MYLDNEAGGVFPKAYHNLQWFYGGKIEAYAGGFVLNPRPLNRYLGADPFGNRVAEVFHCPSDHGFDYLGRGPWGTPSTYDYYGNSYPTNSELLVFPAPNLAPIRLANIRVPFPLMILAGDAQSIDPGGRNLKMHGHAEDGLSVNLVFLDAHAAFLRLDPNEVQTARYSYVIDWVDPNDPNSR